MLTFRFDGVSGEMVEEEILTAGMVGKEIRFQFSGDWDGLRKAVVYQAGEISCTVVDVQQEDTIPAAVLSMSLRRLYVGIYGMSEDGTVVTPTIYARGPFIRIGASEGDGDSGYAPQDPFWLRMEEAVAQTLRFTPQSLTEEQQLQSRENINAAKEDPEAAKLLLEILKNGVYVSDQTGNIRRLSTALTGAVYWSITNALENVRTDNETEVVEENGAYTATLQAAGGCSMNTVTVIMGGLDITDQVYADGIITIPAVTGDVVITAVATEGIADVIYVPASVSSAMLNRQEYPCARLSAVLRRMTADTPFPQNGDLGLGDLYLIPVPAEASVLKVVSPGVIGGPQFFNLSGGTYTQALDVGWQTVDGFTYSFEAGAYGYLAINFKDPTNGKVFTADHDTSGFRISFE